jgi:hypothetical protein
MRSRSRRVAEGHTCIGSPSQVSWVRVPSSALALLGGILFQHRDCEHERAFGRSEPLPPHEAPIAIDSRPWEADRVLVRHLALGALLFVGLAIPASASNPNRETVRINAADQAAAASALLKRADLYPGFNWRGGRVRPDSTPNPTCPNYHPDLSVFVVTGHAASRWTDAPYEVYSETEVLQSADMVRREWKAQIVTPAAVPCLRSSFAKGVAAAGNTFVSFKRIPFPRIASYSAGFRLVGVVNGFRYVADTATLGTGRTEIVVSVGAVVSQRRYVAAETKRLARILVRRAKT